QLPLKGMTKMLAQYSEAKYFSTDKIELCVAETHKHLLDKTYQGKLKSQLESHFGKPIEINFSLGGVAGMTPAAQLERNKQEKQSQAVDAIESDPYIRE